MTSSPPVEATLVACLTPPGAGAIATLALRGPLAWPIVRELFRIGLRQPGKELPQEPAAGKHWLGRLGGDPAGACADEVILVVKQANPIPWLELHCHGGREVVRYLLEILAGRGAQVRTWQDLERSTSDDPIQAAALTALALAPTARTAAILLDQYQGALTRALTAIRAALAENHPADAEINLAALARHIPLGRHLTSPWKVVVAGAPNVGKSSLVNALAGYQRSVVAATPGTTRDVVTTAIAVDGWPVELADTAGIRSSGEELEQMGIDRAWDAAGQADLCLWVLDASAPAVFPALVGKTLRSAINKIDLPFVPGFVPPADGVAVSATLGQGIAELCRALANWLVPDPPPPGAAVPFTPFLCDRIEDALRAISQGRSAEASNILDDPAPSG